MPARYCSILIAFFALPAWGAPVPAAKTRPPPAAPVAAAKAAPKADTEPPKIEPVAPSEARAGDALTLRARITDASAIFSPVLTIRAPGQAATTLNLTALPDGTYAASLTPTGDFEYWFEAYDEYGNGPARAGSPQAPFSIRLVKPAPAPSPVQVVEAQKPAEAAPEAPENFDFPPEEAAPSRVPVDAIVGSAGFAGLIVAVIAGGLAVSSAREWKAAADTNNRTAWLEARDQTRSRALVANVAWGVGGVLTAAGLGLYLSGAF